MHTYCTHMLFTHAHHTHTHTHTHTPSPMLTCIQDYIYRISLKREFLVSTKATLDPKEEITKEKETIPDPLKEKRISLLLTGSTREEEVIPDPKETKGHQ